MHILITRPEPEATRFAAQLKEHGLDAVIAPLTTIDLTDTPVPPLDGVQALVFTSANGVRAYAAKQGRTDLPVYAVGDATAAAARRAGFGEIASAGSDWRGLAHLLAQKLDPAKGRLLHPTGEHRAGDLPEALRAHGFDLVQAAIYRAAPVADLPEAARTGLESGALDAVALFSPRNVALLVERVEAAGLSDRLAALDAFCLSPAVADAAANRATWRSVHIAAHPNAEAMLASIQDHAGDAPKGAGQEAAGGSDAERIIAAFGGIRPMAKTLGIAVTTVQGWKERGAIPLKRMAEIREAAARSGVDLDAAGPPAGPAEPEITARPQGGPAAGAHMAAEAVAAEPVSHGPEPGLRAAEAPPPTLDAERADRPRRPWRWALFGGGFGAALIAGGVLAVLLGLGRSENGGGDQRLALDRLQSRIGAITSQLEDEQKRQQAAAAALQTRISRIAALEKMLGEQRERMSGLAGNVAALAARVEKLDADLKTIGARAPAGTSEVKALQDQVGALAKRIDALPKGGTDTAAVTALSAELKQFGDRLGALETRVGDIARKQAADAGAWQSALDSAAASLKAETGKLGAEAGRLKQELAALAESVKHGSLGEGAGALLIAVGQLRRAVRDGHGYAAALDSVAALAKGRDGFAAALAVLKPKAAKGIPTLASLRARFGGVAVAVLRGAAAPAPDADIWDRIWSRMQGLVTVRRVGDVPGDTPAAKVSRAEAALGRGDLAAAVKEMSNLTGAAKQAAAAWVADAEARIAAGGALSALDRAALAAVQRPAPKAQP